MQSTNSEHGSPYLTTYVTHHFTLLLLDIIINTQIKRAAIRCAYILTTLIAIMFLLQFVVEIELFIGGYYKNMTDLSRNTLNTRPCPSGSHLIRRWKSVRRSGNIYSLLERFGFGTQCLSLIKLLYFSSKASVITNRVRSKYSPLSRGTRQGCS